MLRTIRVVGFKSLKNVVIDFSKITVLIGLNGSGKSSVIQALGILKQSLGNNKLITSAPLLNLGTFEDISTHNQSTISFHLIGRSPSYDRRTAILRSQRYNYGVTLDQNGIVRQETWIGRKRQPRQL